VLRGLYRVLVRRLPPGAAWALWRAGVLAASARRRGVAGPPVALAHVAWGASENELGPLIDGLVADSGAATSAILVVSDCDAVHVAAARGCRLEHVPRRDDWQRAFPAESYERFLSSRGRGIGAAYRIERLKADAQVPEMLRRGLEDAAGVPLEER
jgi:hypothetical protein